MSFRVLTATTFPDVISEGTVLVKVGASWCPPCKTIEPVLQALADEIGVDVVEVDADDEPELVAEYGVRALPTVILFREGQAVGQVVGAHKIDKYRELLLG